jgi:hypothetical protein
VSRPALIERKNIRKKREDRGFGTGSYKKKIEKWKKRQN